MEPPPRFKVGVCGGGSPERQRLRLMHYSAQRGAAAACNQWQEHLGREDMHHSWGDLACTADPGDPPGGRSTPLGAPVPGRRTPPLCPPHQQLNLNTCRRLFQSSVPLWDFLIFTPNFRGRLLTTADSEWAGPLEPDRHHYGMLGPLLRWLDRPLDAPPPDPRTFHSHHTS